MANVIVALINLNLWAPSCGMSRKRCPIRVPFPGAPTGCWNAITTHGHEDEEHNGGHRRSELEEALTDGELEVCQWVCGRVLHAGG